MNVPRAWVCVLAMAIAGYAEVAGATTCISNAPHLRTSRLAGQVFDPQGLPLEGAKVTVASEGGPVLEMGTDEHGFFQAADIASGHGIVTVTALFSESYRVEWDVERRLPQQILVVQLGIGGCSSAACTVLVPSPTPLSKAPKCLAAPPSDSDEGRWASATRALDRLAAGCAAREKAACAALARAAVKGDPNFRVYAANGLTDQALLAGLVEPAREEFVRVAAAGHLTDPTLLARLAASDSSDYVREAAAANPHFTDSSALALLAAGDRRSSVRQSALQNPNLADGALVARIAAADDDRSVRVAAIGRLSDPRRLRSIAEDERDPGLRGAAIANPAWSDQALFARLAMADESAYVRQIAFRRIDDPALRRQAAAYANAEAVATLANAGQLAEIVRTSKDPELREAAARKLPDEQQVIEVLGRETQWRVRHSAVNNPVLKDQDVLTKVARFDREPAVRVVAAMKLDEPALAQRVFAEVVASQGEGRWLWGELAVSRITDQALLARIAENEEQGLRRAAIWRLEDQSVLERLARNDESSELRRIATTKLTSVDLLRQIASNDGDWFVRRAAEARLKYLGR